MLISQLYMLESWEQNLLFELFLDPWVNFWLDLIKFFVKMLCQKVDWDIAIFKHMRVSSEHFHIESMDIKTLFGDLLFSLLRNLLLVFTYRLRYHVKGLFAWRWLKVHLFDRVLRILRHIRLLFILSPFFVLIRVVSLSKNRVNVYFKVVRHVNEHLWDRIPPILLHLCNCNLVF